MAVPNGRSGDGAALFEPRVRSVGRAGKKTEAPRRIAFTHEETSRLASHILLRAAIGLDRRGTIARHRALIAQTEAVLGGNFVPAQTLAKVRVPPDHPMHLAIAYDLWRLGDYGESKAALMEALRSEPLAPPMTLE